ncbi:MAG: monofunctional biosynthetic peptidoglycan transglycosylase [Gammaproteobacteria bacterium]|nr:MAG: monofunctional biosynthetic peptidoglycan transglycosylase [Gammaproteobacteria bacterium]
MARRRWFARLARTLVLTGLLVAAASVLPIVACRWLPVPVTSFMLLDRGTDQPRQHAWIPWDRISPHAALAVIAAEDQRFPQHAGFDFEAIDQALTAAGRGRRLRGASTISQQLAKNLFLWPGRSWPRKSLEIWFTAWLELLWPKQRILEVYLNVVEFGPGIWGVEAASRHYFGRSAARLSREQAALLAAVLPNPKRYSVAAPSAWIRERQRWILGQMQALGGPAYLERLQRARLDASQRRAVSSGSSLRRA